MKKSFFLAAMAVAALASCQKTENPMPQMKSEMSFIPMAGAPATRGYSLGNVFDQCTYATLHEGQQLTYRDMQISAYLYPQNGEEGNYFVDKTYKHGADALWHNFNGANLDPIYWPVGGTMDFLAYSFSEPKSIDVVWNEANAASQVVMDVPGENTQNDILFSSAYAQKSINGAKPVEMVFDHAQAWIEFQLTGSADADKKEVVKFKRIELENVYNAGVLTIDNNKGKATATWDFSAETKKNIVVDDNYPGPRVNGYLDATEATYLDMLLPQQKKTAFVIYYTLGSDDQELSYRFTTDLKTWLMGEKYIYKINITTNEVTVEPKVTEWKPVTDNQTII